MLHLRNINPMVRAVGTMGAVSALVGGITFAQLTSNTVALSPNTLSTGTANLEIGALGRNPNNGGNTDNLSTISPTTNTTNTTNTGNTSNDTSNPNNTSASTSDQANVSSNDVVRGTNNNSCTDTTNGTIPGFNLTGTRGLLPGVQSRPLNFCLSNTSRVPLNLTVAIPDDPFTSTTGLQPTDITLDIKCDNGGHANGTLSTFLSTATPIKTLGSLSANDSTDCAAKVVLSNSATISGTETLPSFDIKFTGTTSS